MIIDILIHFPFEWRDVAVFAAGFFTFPLLFILFAVGFGGP